MTLYGLDIGGGTPTSIDAEIFAELISQLSEYISDKKVSSDFEPSIEGSFNTLVDDYLEKNRSYHIAQAGDKTTFTWSSIHIDRSPHPSSSDCYFTQNNARSNYLLAQSRYFKNQS